MTSEGHDPTVELTPVPDDGHQGVHYEIGYGHLPPPRSRVSALSQPHLPGVLVDPVVLEVPAREASIIHGKGMEALLQVRKIIEAAQKPDKPLAKPVPNPAQYLLK